MSEPMTSTFTARHGGVLTREVGAVTGRLELETSEREGQLVCRVRYEGADEWYHLEDAPKLAEEAKPAAVHAALVGALSGPDAPGPNPSEAAHGEGEGHDADDPAAGSFGGARRG